MKSLLRRNLEKNIIHPNFETMCKAKLEVKFTKITYSIATDYSSWIHELLQTFSKQILYKSFISRQPSNLTLQKT